MENIENRSDKLKDENADTSTQLRDARKKGISKGVMVTGIIALVIFFISGVIVVTGNKKENNRQAVLMENQRTSFTKELAARDSTINVWLATADEIEKELNLVKQKENSITFGSTKTEFSVNRKEKILNDIKYINNLLENNKKKINSLTAQLKRSGGMIKGLQARLESLETKLSQYESDMADLKVTLAKKDDEIGQLNSKMTALDNTISQQGKELTDQTAMINQAYIASGTFKDLKEKGIIEKEGGFLGLGKKKSLVPNPDETAFTKIDIRDTKTIQVNSREAKLIPEHPSGSYEMVHNDDGNISYVEIKDPVLFWKTSRFAVIEFEK